MLNQVILVGRLVKDPELKKTDSGRDYTQITLAVPRSYKNIHGEYETDFLDCTLWSGIALNTTEYCSKGDIIGIKGRIESSIYKKDDKNVYSKDIIVEKVNFLKTKEKKEENNC